MKIDLHGSWDLLHKGKTIAIEVPGVIEKYVEKRDDSGVYSYYREFQLNLKNDKSYILTCKGISYGYSIFINAKQVFYGEGVWGETIVDITEYLQENNTIEVSIDRPSFDRSSRYHFRSILFGFIPDVLFPFSGIFRPIFIEELDPCYCKNLEVIPCVHSKSVRVSVETSIPLAANQKLHISCFFQGSLVFQYETTSLESSFSIKEAHAWSPESPNMYTCTVELVCGDNILQKAHRTFGFREITVDGYSVKINGVKQYFRGILHWGYYPEKMSVYQSEEEIRRELETIQSMGFNAIKFCLFIPEQRYYELCDEMGIMVWQELPLWLPYDNGYLIDRIRMQFPAMIKQVIFHPSLLYMSIGCELDSTIPSNIINDIYSNISDYKSSVVICDNSGGGECFEGNTDTESDIYDYHFYGEIHHMKRLIHEFSHQSRVPKPWLFGEFNDMDTFRNISGARTLAGNAPYWTNKDFEKNLLRYVHQGFGSDNPVYNFEDIVNSYGYQSFIPLIERKSLEKSYWVRKYNLETVRSFQNISGYAITAIRDVPITATGLIDDCGKSKFEGDRMKMINTDIVISLLPPLLRSWYRGSDIYDSHDLFSFQEGSFIDNRVIISSTLSEDFYSHMSITCRSAENVIYTESFPITLQEGLSREYTQLRIPLPELRYPMRYNLEIRIGEYCNRWDIWSYPKNYSATFFIYDPTNMFDQIEGIFSCSRLLEVPKTLEGTLLTTVYTEEIATLYQQGTHIVYVQQGIGLLPLDYLPFWRENVKLIHEVPELRELQHLGYDGGNFLSVTTKIGFDGIMLRQIYPDYTPLLSRIDNRNFKLHEHAIFVPSQKENLMCSGNLVITSLNFSGGEGDQARDFSCNYFGQSLLNAFILIAQRGNV